MYRVQQKGDKMEAKMNELRTLWDRLLGNPPDLVQFEVWRLAHSFEVVQHGIIKVAEKNLSMQRLMEPDHRLRYCSSVMNHVEGSPRPLVAPKLVMTGAA